MAVNTLTKTHSVKSLGFYTLPQASRITQVPLWTLNSWRRNGIILPSAEWVDEINKEHLGHTFDTVVFIRLLRILREKEITLFEAVKAVERLRERFGPPSKKWADAKIFVYGKDVYVHDSSDTWDTTVATRKNQKVAEFIFGNEFVRLRERADALLIPKQFMNHVEIDPSIQNGLPIVLDTVVQTSLIHKLRQQGYKYTDIQEMYSFIPKPKIIGAEEYETFLDQKVSRN